MRSLASIGAAALAAAILLTAIACASGTKSGGKTTHVIKIVMQTPDAPEADAEYFIKQVKDRSGGRIQIVEGNDRYSSVDPDNEARLVRALRSGKVEMAYLPSRAWERASSVTAFRALQAPFLVTNYPLLRQITTGPIGTGMLASLSGIGIVGLGLVPDELRRALGRRPLASLTTFRGARIRVITSPTSVLALRSIGAVPLTNYTSNTAGTALKSGRLDGLETATNSIANNGYTSDAPYLTANLVLYAKTQTIAIRKSVFDRLSGADQAVLRAAAAATVNHADPAAQELSDLHTLCRQGLRLVNASTADLTSLQRLAQPAYATLERSAATRKEITAIEQLKSQAGGTASLPACPAPSANGQGSKNGVLAGTYAITASHSEIAGVAGSVPNSNWGSFLLVLHGGRFRLSDTRPGGVSAVGPPKGFSAGTYATHGDRITFTSQTSGGDTPLGAGGDPPVVCRWSLYRGELSFRRLSIDAQRAAGARGLDPLGPPLLYVKPWPKGRGPRAAVHQSAAGFPTGTFETKITPADVRGVSGPAWWAHWETLTFTKNGTFIDVWFHPRRTDQPTVHGRYLVRGNRLYEIYGPGRKDSFSWSYDRGALIMTPLSHPDLDTLGMLIYTAHLWRKIK